MALIDSKNIVICGHRGVGKSTFARRLAHYFPEFQHFDLDDVISQRAGKTVSDFFATEGESSFRQEEKNAFHWVLSQSGKKIVSLGAGFEMSELRGIEDVLLIWFRRKSDELGRVFLDRPRLEKSVSALEEFSLRKEAREPHFLSQSALIWTSEEGALEPLPEEKVFFESGYQGDACLTVLPRHLKQWGWVSKVYKNFELRTDLLTAEEMEAVLSSVGGDRILLAHRPGALSEEQELLSVFAKVPYKDWAMELGIPPDSDSWPILSCHRGDLVDAFLEQAPKHVLAKLALNVENFSDLQNFHGWQMEEPDKRVFLPISNDGKWEWYRLQFGLSQPLQFVSDGFGSAPDQPTALRLLRTPPGREFAAVLGKPVAHSWTPQEQKSCFPRTYSIEVNESEFANAVSFLQSSGMVAAAVTSPLKTLAKEISDISESELASANTLLLKDKIVSTNTDVIALEVWLSGLESVAVWGGGGVLPALQKVLPQAHFFSASTGKLRDFHNSNPFESYQNLIWACGDKLDNILPPESWGIKQVFDLSYVDSSRGRELAIQRGCAYESGEKMFRLQAAEQRKFWQRLKSRSSCD